MSRARRANIIESSTVHNLLPYAYMCMCGGVFNNSVARPCHRRLGLAGTRTKQKTALTHTFVNHRVMDANVKTKETKCQHPCRTPVLCARRTKKSTEIIADALQWRRPRSHRGLELTHEIIFFVFLLGEHRVYVCLLCALRPHLDSTLSFAISFFFHSVLVSSPSIFVARYSIYLMRHSDSNCSQQQQRRRRQYSDKTHRKMKHGMQTMKTVRTMRSEGSNKSY